MPSHADTMNILPLVEQVQSGPSFDHRPIAVLIVVTSTLTIPCFAANVENHVLRPGQVQKHDPNYWEDISEFVRKFREIKQPSLMEIPIIFRLKQGRFIEKFTS